MPVTNIECQLAKGQIGRYLAGENLSGEALKQLEEHVSECSACKKSLAERKAALQEMLGETTPAAAAVEAAPAPAPPPNPMAEALRRQAEAEKEALAERVSDQIRLAREAAASAKPTFAAKPILLSAALAAVLIAMSTFARPGASPFGPKAEAEAPFASGPTAKATPPARPRVTVRAAPALKPTAAPKPTTLPKPVLAKKSAPRPIATVVATPPATTAAPKKPIAKRVLAPRPVGRATWRARTWRWKPRAPKKPAPKPAAKKVAVQVGRRPNQFAPASKQNASGTGAVRVYR